MLGSKPEISSAPPAGVAPPPSVPGAPPVTAPTEAPQGFDQAYDQLRQSSDIQFNMQNFVPPRLEPSSVPSSMPSLNLGPVIEVIFWIVIALVAAGILYLIVTRVMGWSWKRRAKDEAPEALEPEWQIDAPVARRLLQEADTLAAAGRFDEAVRVLLFRSIDEIDTKRPETVRPAFTSRDIARLPALPANPGEAFGRIVRAVERSLFARQPLGASDWQDCRAAYERFAFAGEWKS